MNRLISVPHNPRIGKILPEADRPKAVFFLFEDYVGLIEGCLFNRRMHQPLLSVIFGHSEYCIVRWSLGMIHSECKTIHLPAADADPEDDWSKLVLVHLPSLTGMVKPLQVS